MLRTRLLLSSLLLLAPLVATAAVGIWTTSGPEGGQVLSFVIVPGEPGRVLAGTLGGGVFESRDGGARWSHLGLGDRTVRALELAPDDTRTIYAGTDSGFFVSRDGGLTWESRSSGLAPLPISDIAVDPSDPSRIYAALYQFGSSSPSGGLFRSPDAGDSWAPTGLGGAIRSVIIDPRSPNVLYAILTGRFYGTVLRSLDAGGTWRELDVSTGSELALAMDPNDSNVLYTGVWDQSTGTGLARVFRSTDAGATWTPAGAALSHGDFHAILVDPLDRATIYAATDAGIFVSRDAGETWTRVHDRKTVALALDPGTGFTFAAESDGVAVSRDGGATWTKGTSGLIATEVVALGAASNDLFARTPSEVFRSTDRGASWKEEPPLPPGAFGFAVHPANPAHRFAGIVEVGICQGVFRSLDAGASWAPTSLTFGCIASFAFDPRTPTTVYAIGQFGLWRSDDESSSWTSVSPGDAVLSFVVDPATPSTLYAGAVSRGVFRSDDSGATWRAVNNGIPDASTGCASDGTQCPKRRITALAVDPLRPSTIYAGVVDPPFFNGSTFVGGEAGVWKSIDRG